MILLAIESATDLVGAAVVGDEGGAVERVHAGGRAHAEHLAPSIEEACALAGCRVTDLDRIAVDIGPGLFTGLRVGVATAKALAQALGIGVLGMGSLDILAAAAWERTGGPATGPVVAVVDARRGEVFAAAYHQREDRQAARDDPDPAAVRLDRPGPLTPRALDGWLRELAAGHPRVVVVGDGAVRYRDQLSAPALDFALAEDLRAPPPSAQALLARRRLAAGVPASSPADLVPDYRRAADARINWEQRLPEGAPAGREGSGRAR